MLQWCRYALLASWNLADGDTGGEEEGWYLRGYNVKNMFECEYRKLPKSLQKRLKYYREIVKAAGTEDVLLFGASQATYRDGQKTWYAETLVNELNINKAPSLPPIQVSGLPYTHTVLEKKYEDVLIELRSLAARLVAEAIIESAENLPSEGLKEPLLLPPGSQLFRAADFVGIGRFKKARVQE